jgi:50S ribosomal protein L16 3-hydroxylase
MNSENADSFDWDNFSRNHWEKRPLIFSGGKNLLDKTKIFHALKTANNNLQTGAAVKHKDVRFHIGDSLQLDATPYLPTPEELSLASYLDRLESVTDNKHFTLLINSFQQFSPEIWREMRMFLMPLFRQIGGLPAGMVDSTLLIGKYGISPFKVHKDPNSVFTFIVQGEKDIVVWPFSIFANKTEKTFAEHKQIDLDGLDYSPYEDQGLRLQGVEKNVLYWPSTFWHVGLSNPGALHISLHITCHLHARPRLAALEMMMRLDENNNKDNKWIDSYPVDFDSIGQSNTVLPASAKEPIAELSSELNSGILDLETTLNWLSRITAHGFNVVPYQTYNISSISDDDVMIYDHHFPVAWHHRDSNIYIAANGRVIRVPYEPWMVLICSSFASSFMQSVASLLMSTLKEKTATNQSVRNYAVTLLLKIGQIGGFTIKKVKYDEHFI